MDNVAFAASGGLDAELEDGLDGPEDELGCLADDGELTVPRAGLASLDSTFLLLRLPRLPTRNDKLESVAADRTLRCTDGRLRAMLTDKCKYYEMKK